VSNAVVQDVYAPSNSNQHIGDVLQSGKKFGERYFWVANNSGKIIITDKNFVKIGSVSGLISPRYIEFVSNNKAYVTNLQLNNAQPNYIQVLDLNTYQVTKTIRLDGWTEEMVQSYGKVYVCNQKRKYVYVINASSDLIIDSIDVNASSANIVKDKNEKLWVSCNADAANNISARLVRIDPARDSVEAEISLNTTQNSVSRMVINGNGDGLYFLLGDLYTLSIGSNVPTSLVQQGARIFYGLCVDPDDETIYIGDAIDYNQDGNILVYKADGSYKNTFKAGIIPGYMWFDE
jgi:DNA-binding beta-propeller fold protein YncE